jgi:hypothetical protein
MKGNLVRPGYGTLDGRPEETTRTANPLETEVRSEPDPPRLDRKSEAPSHCTSPMPVLPGRAPGRSLTRVATAIHAVSGNMFDTRDV